MGKQQPRPDFNVFGINGLSEFGKSANDTLLLQTPDTINACNLALARLEALMSTIQIVTLEELLSGDFDIATMESRIGELSLVDLKYLRNQAINKLTEEEQEISRMTFIKRCLHNLYLINTLRLIIFFADEHIKNYSISSAA